MCQKETPPGTQNPKPARRTRTKTRRPKFLSLRLKLAPESRPEKIHHHHCRKNRLNLFPLHAESVDVHDDSSVAHFFHSDGGASLTGLLSAGNVVSDQMYGVSSMSTDRDESRSPASLTCAYGGARDRGEGGGGDAGSSLVRTAMRRRRRGEEERWVSYEDVVEKKEEEVTSCSADIPYHHHGPMSEYHVDQPNQRLSLKLDYEEIMNAWSDKGPLYVVDAEAPQTVPDVNDDFLWPDSGANVWVDGWGGGGGAGKEGLWRVPEKDEGGINMMTTTMGNEEEEEGEGANRGGCLKWKKIKKMEQREASVLRYKEKRRNRLFSKRIRYEVRKLNAEKRPRIKGRFVKRS